LYFYSSSAPATTLAANLSSAASGSTGSVEVENITGLPTRYPFTLILVPGNFDAEVITVTQAATGSGPYTFANSVRGDDGTTAGAHNAGVVVQHGIAARDLYQGGNDWINPLAADYGADPTGVNDSTAAIQAAISAVPASGGVVYLPAGTYKVSSTLNITASGVYLAGAGRWATTISFTGTGDCIRALDASTYTTRTVQGGGVLGLTIAASGAGSGSCGLHAGDFLQYRIDVAITGFSGTSNIGLHLDNANYWTEQAVVTAYINDCNEDVVFDCSGADTSAGSYDRGDFTFYISHTTFTGSSIIFTNGAYIVGGRLRIFGNYNSRNTTFTQAVLQLTGATPGGHPSSESSLSTCELDIGVESDESDTYTFQTINYGSLSNTITDCSGNVSFGAGNQFTASNITTLSSQFTFAGPVIGDTTLEEVTIPSRMAVNGEIFLHSSISTLLAGSVSYTPSNPAGTSGTAVVMMGLGTAVTFTPGLTGKVAVTFNGTWYTSGTAVNGTLSGRYGTATAPVNGTVSTGTRFGTGTSDMELKTSSTGFGISFSISQVLSLTPNTAYWFDLAQSSETGGTTEPGNIVATLMELLA
jgi:hypothetical protein